MSVGIQRVETSRGHSYKIDGRKADGVTTLIKNGLPNKALMYWSARAVAEYVADNMRMVNDMVGLGRNSMVAALKEVPWTSRDAASAKGTDVHTLAEKLIHGVGVDVPEHLSGYVEACVKFMDEWQIQPKLVEAVVANRQWRYCGTLDLADDRLFDYKTGRSGIWPETALQLSAYANAEVYLDNDGAEQPMPELSTGYAVWLRPDGYDVVPVDIGPEVYKTFLHIAYVARQAAAMKTWVREPVPAPRVAAPAEMGEVGF